MTLGEKSNIIFMKCLIDNSKSIVFIKVKPDRTDVFLEHAQGAVGPSWKSCQSGILNLKS